MKNFFISIQYFLYDLFHVLKYTWFLIIFLLIGNHVLTNVDQATDAFIAMVNREENSHIFFVFLFTVLWAICTWYSARLILYITSIKFYNERFSMLIQKWLPRLLGLIPFFILATAFSKPYCSANYGTFVTFFLGLCFLIFVIFRKRRIKDEDRFKADGKEFNELSYKTRRVVFGAFIAILLILILFMFFKIGLHVSMLWGPVAMIIFALAMWCFGGTLVVFIDYKTKLPVSLMLLILVIIFSHYNNNHQIRYDETESYIPKNELDSTQVKEYFQKWIAQRKDTSANPYPVFIVSAEGGGIRSAYWTVSVLSKLSESIPGFYDHTFAVSGVSGGSLGATVFTGLCADKLKKEISLDSSNLHLSRKILSYDFLSPLNAALLFPDMLQKFLPVSVARFDRARWLEDAWDHAYHESTETVGLKGGGSHAMNQDFLDLWDSIPCGNLPSLFLNCTKVETGEKAIMSNLSLSDSSFVGVIDLQEKIKKHVALKTATLLSARFPLFTPPGTIIKYCPDCEDWFNVVDGGYIDNTGLVTAQAITNTIYKLKKENKDSSSVVNRVKVYMIFIKNSAPFINERSSLTGLLETKAPLSAFINAWDNSGITTVTNTYNYFQMNQEGGDLLTFQLNRQEGTMPLGWYLSKNTQSRINDQIDKLGIQGVNKEAYLKVENLLKYDKTAKIFY